MGFQKTPIKYNTVMGLDISTNSIAFSVFENDQLVSWGELTMTGSTPQRCVQAARYARNLGKRFPVDKVSYEAAAYVNNRRTVISLAYFIGAVVSSVGRDSTVFEEIPAITWQNAIGNKALTKAEKHAIRVATPDKSAAWYKQQEREFRKRRTMTWVADNYEVDAPNDNVADAIAIGYIGTVR